MALGPEGLDVGIERSPCDDWALHPPLEPGEGIYFWLSTAGTTHLQFARGRFDLPADATVRLNLWPEREGDGWGASLELTTASRERAGATLLEPDDPLFHPSYAAGAHRLRVERIELGPQTRFEGGDGRLVTDRYVPDVHVLVHFWRAEDALSPTEP